MIAFVGLAVSRSLVAAEFGEGPDEETHFYFTRFVAEHGRLPLTEVEKSAAGYKADSPPLFYLVAGYLGSFVDLESPPFVKITRDNPRLQLVFGPKNVRGWQALNTEDPLRGEISLWYMARWTTLLFGLVGAVGAYFLVRATQPGYPWLALSGAALLAFLPRYLYISSVISYETLTGALLTFYFLLLFYIINDAGRAWLYLGAGLLLGLAAATRYTPVPAVLLLPLLVIWLAYRQSWSWPTTLSRLGLAGLGIVVTFGSWVLYSLTFFNKVDSQGWIYGLINPFLLSDGSDTVSLQIVSYLSGGEWGAIAWGGGRDSLLQWAWQLFGPVWGSNWLAWIFLALFIVALIGLVRGWRDKNETPRLWIVFLAFNIGAFLIFPLLRFLVSGDASTGRAQHILFPAGAALLLLLIYGLRFWLSPTRLTWLLSVFVLLYLVQAPISIIQNYSPAWPIQTVPLSDKEQALAQFNQISLLEYRYQADDRLLRIILQWRADELTAEDYWIELTLVDQNGESQARWLGQPLNGRYPTRAWAEGDRVRDVIDIPIANLPPGDYRVQLRLLGEAGAVPPAAAADQSAPMAIVERDQLNLASVTLAPATAAGEETITLNGREIGYTYWPAQPVGAEGAVYREYSTIIVTTAERLGDGLRVSLAGPDGQSRPPVDRVGFTHIFQVKPHFTNGPYRLRFEVLAGTEVIAQAESEPLLEIETEERQFDLPAAIAHPVWASFAGYVALLGYDLPERQVQPGETLPLTLYWQALRTIGADLNIFIHLIDAEQNIWGGRDRRAREVYSTMLWAPNEIVSDPFTIQIDPDAPDGIYQLLVGLYLPVGQAPVSLPLVHEDGQMSDVTSVALGPIKIGQAPPGLTVTDVKPQFTMDQPLGDGPNLTLLGYDLTDAYNQPLEWGGSMPSGEVNAVKLTLYWRVEAPLPVDYTTFVHIRDRARETVAQMDQPPLQGAYPTSLWEPGEIIADEIILPFPDDLPADGFGVVAGMYDFQTDNRLAVPGNAANEVVLMTVE
jgi:hypothetical protein